MLSICREFHWNFERKEWIVTPKVANYSLIILCVNFSLSGDVFRSNKTEQQLANWMKIECTSTDSYPVLFVRKHLFGTFAWDNLIGIEECRQMRCIFDFWSLNDDGNMKVSAIPTTYESLTPIYVDQNRSDAWRENNCLQKTEKKYYLWSACTKTKIRTLVTLLASTTRAVIIHWLH